MHGVKLPVLCVGWIKRDRNDSGGVAAIGGEFWKDVRELQVWREFLRRCVENVERAALVVHKNALGGERRAGWLGAQRCDAPKLRLIVDPRRVRAGVRGVRERRIRV